MEGQPRRSRLGAITPKSHCSSMEEELNDGPYEPTTTAQRRLLQKYYSERLNDTNHRKLSRRLPSKGPNRRPKSAQEPSSEYRLEVSSSIVEFHDDMTSGSGGSNILTGSEQDEKGCMIVPSLPRKPKSIIKTQDVQWDPIPLETKDDILKIFSLDLESKPPMTSTKRSSLEEIEAGEISKKFAKIFANRFFTIDVKEHRPLIADNLADFVSFPVPVGFVLKCQITRQRDGLNRGMFPLYTVHLEENDEKVILLMTARMRKKATKPDFLISVDPTNLWQDGDSIVGEMTGNFIGTEFTLFDGCPAKKDACHFPVSPDSREELGVIQYEPNFLVDKGPRKMRVLLPALVTDVQRLGRRPIGKDYELLAEEGGKFGLKRGLIELKNKWPRFHELSSSYILDFHGRVTKPSVKNFQIVHPKQEDYLILQFGRISEESFTMDVRFPLCPLQAFAIAISSLTRKLLCN